MFYELCHLFQTVQNLFSCKIFENHFKRYYIFRHAQFHSETTSSAWVMVVIVIVPLKAVYLQVRE